MKNYKILILFLFTTTCKSFLDPYPNGDRTRDDVFKYQESVQGLIGRSYDYLCSDIRRRITTAMKRPTWIVPPTMRYGV